MDVAVSMFWAGVCSGGRQSSLLPPIPWIAESRNDFGCLRLRLKIRFLGCR